MFEHRLYICFAAHNEQENLPVLLERMETLAAQNNYRYQIFAYEDGSQDNTLAMLHAAAARMPLTVMHEPVNHGLGYGIGKMIARVCQESQDGKDVAVFLDADDTHDPGSIPSMIEKLSQGADFVIASRFCPGGHMQGFPLFRRMLSHAASIFFRVILPIPGLRDYTSGYRAYSIAALKQAIDRYGDRLVTENGFSCQVELVFKLSPFVRFAEVPMDYRYDRKQGDSKMKLLRTIRRTLLLGWRILLRRRH